VSRYTFPEVPDLPAELGRLLGQIPPGYVTTCGTLAEALGNRLAARWIGHFLLHHEHTADCRCHRVLLAGGHVGRYLAGGPAEKIQRLEAEGVAVSQGIVDLDRFAWPGFEGDRPLTRLQHLQEALAAQVRLSPRRRVPKFVGAVDVAYPTPAEAVAAFALVETATGVLVWAASVRGPVRFPYISSFLSFREIPIYLELLAAVEQAGRLPEVLLVDGSGVLHQRHAGIATHLGVTARLATIGVTKSLLCGRPAVAELAAGQSCPVVIEDRVIGVALRPMAGSRRSIFISPGHRVDLAFAEALVRQFLRGRRLPEPLYWADRLSRTPMKS
jgi:deoxyribonuclease V